MYQDLSFMKIPLPEDVSGRCSRPSGRDIYRVSDRSDCRGAGCVAGVFQKNRYPSGHRCRHFLDGRRQNTGGLDVVFHIDINASIK